MERFTRSHFPDTPFFFLQGRGALGKRLLLVPYQ